MSDNPPETPPPLEGLEPDVTLPEPERSADERVEDELGPGEPDEVINDPENQAAAEAIRKSTLDQPQLEDEPPPEET